jgi:hypothetical protein
MVALRKRAEKHELRREAAPEVSRVAVLRNPTNPDAADVSRGVERAARAGGRFTRLGKAQSGPSMAKPIPMKFCAGATRIPIGGCGLRGDEARLGHAVSVARAPGRRRASARWTNVH